MKNHLSELTIRLADDFYDSLQAVPYLRITYETQQQLMGDMAGEMSSFNTWVNRNIKFPGCAFEDWYWDDTSPRKANKHKRAVEYEIN